MWKLERSCDDIYEYSDAANHTLNFNPFLYFAIWWCITNYKWEFAVLNSCRAGEVFLPFLDLFMLTFGKSHLSLMFSWLLGNHILIYCVFPLIKPSSCGVGWCCWRLVCWTEPWFQIISYVSETCFFISICGMKFLKFMKEFAEGSIFLSIIVVSILAIIACRFKKVLCLWFAVGSSFFSFPI